jgi:aryl-alcohol dehydrogenase-like predicted oxidoreductase
VRHIGITETSPNDPEQKMLSRAIQEAPWEVTMLAYSLMNQGARHRIFPETQRRGIGTLLMFVVRNIFSKPDYRRDIFAKQVEQGDLDASILSKGDPLGFLVAEGAAESITDAAYRYARHEQGVDVVLFGTGNKAHVKDNVDSILRPPLAPSIIERLHASFGHLKGVGLDRPGPIRK